MSDQTIGLSVRSLGVDTSDETTLFPGNVTSLGKQVGAAKVIQGAWHYHQLVGHHASKLLNTDFFVIASVAVII
jgi:hypothetical protein